MTLIFTKTPTFEVQKQMSQLQERHLKVVEEKNTKRSQAQRIIDKFGGHARLFHALKLVDPECCAFVSNIYRWTYPRSKYGTGGIVPTRMLPILLKAARIEGILLTPEDLFPGEL